MQRTEAFEELGVFNEADSCRRSTHVRRVWKAPVVGIPLENAGASHVWEACSQLASGFMSFSNCYNSPSKLLGKVLGPGFFQRWASLLCRVWGAALNPALWSAVAAVQSHPLPPWQPVAR